MSKISQDAARAFENFQWFKRGNTLVRTRLTPHGMEVQLLLHGNLIAYITAPAPLKGNLFISTCGYDTQTTRSRLNALNGVHVQKIRGVLHLNGEPWDGEKYAIPY